MLSEERHCSSPSPSITTTRNDEHSPVKAHLDESDATSMTTASTATTPSPYSNTNNNSKNKPSSAGSSPSSSSSSSSSTSSSGDDATPSWNKLNSLLSPPRRAQSEPNSSLETSPNNCLAITPQHPITTRSCTDVHQDSHSSDCGGGGGGCGEWFDDDYDSEEYDPDWKNSQTPLRRGSPWSIQQALFPEEETENHAPVLGQKAPTRAPMHPTDEGGRPNSNYLYPSSPAQDYTPHAHSHAQAPQPSQPIRTRRSRQRTATDHHQGYLVHEHRRRNSTGRSSKIRASPQPLPSSSSLLRGSPQPPHRPRSSSARSSSDHHHRHYGTTTTTSSTNLEPPHSHSKSKKYKQHKRRHPNKLDLPGLSEDLRCAAFNSSSSILGGGGGTDISLTRTSSGFSISSTTGTAAAATGITATSLSSINWRTILCRLRLTTFVWGLLMIGLTSLGRIAMITSHWEAVNGAATEPPFAPVTVQLPTAGLRGSLLLATVGRQNISPSQDPPPSLFSSIKKKKKDSDNKKNPKEDHHHHHYDDKDKKIKKPEKKLDINKKEDKHAAKPTIATTSTTKDKKKYKPTLSSTSTAKTASKITIKKDKTKARAAGGTARTSSVAQPPPLDPADVIDHHHNNNNNNNNNNKVKYPDHDPSMYKFSSKKRHMTYQRVVILHDDIKTKQSSNKPIAPRKVQQYPTEFTDNTQYYGEYDSSDERLRKMEMREPYSQGECVPMQDWQVTFHPFCNGVHELGVEYLGEANSESHVQLFGIKGYWRYAWRLDLRKQQTQTQQQQQEEEYGDTVVLKTLKFRHDFEDAHFEHDRIDAVAMERLTSSPHVINVFGFCGHSVLTEYANGPRLGELADKSKSKPLARLRIARDIADGLADVHGIDNKDGNNATFVHLDINPANVVSIGSSLKLNDFNIGIIRRWNTTSQEPCGFPAQYPNPQWRSPEESRNENNLTEKVDVFSLGHIFFRLICGHEPWNKLEPGGKPSKEAINAKVQKGRLPFIPETVIKSTDPEVVAIRDAMLDCYKTDPKQRPSAREISQKLEAVLEKLAAERDTSRLLSK